MAKTKSKKSGKAKKPKAKQTKKKSKSKQVKSRGVKLPAVKITKHMNINEIINRCPNTMEVFFKHGFYCMGCQAAAMESLEQGAKAHGMSDEMTDQMVKELNEAAAEEKKYKS